jgi:hypothetical protein
MHCHLPFRALLYRYFFYGWLFRDASRGNRLEKAAASRHNREQARWLPTYMRRWLVLGALLFVVAAFCETMLGATRLSALLYVPSVLSMPYNVVTAVCWCGLVCKWGEMTAPAEQRPRGGRGRPGND